MARASGARQSRREAPRGGGLHEVDMGTIRNWLAAQQRVERQLLADAVTLARQLKLPDLPESWPEIPDPCWPDMRGLRELISRERSDPGHPQNWHQRAIQRARSRPEFSIAYTKMREAIWTWQELASLRRGARAILESVVELARGEGMPWFVAVQAAEVRRLARLTERSFARSIRELEVLAVTRRGRVASASEIPGVPPVCLFSAAPDRERRGSSEAQPTAQWVIRYRRGIPWRPKRAAWWINYDLLTGTGRVLPMFAVSTLTLSPTYQARNKPMGTAEDRRSRAAAERDASMNGPLPEPGLRAPLWRAPS
jgi:hypothetical protein